MAFDGVFSTGSQYLYGGKGPFDAKMLVETFDDLISAESWTANIEGTPTIVAYRGMIVAVRKNSTTYPDARGIYFFHDGKTKKPVTAEEISNISAWNKLCSISELESLTSRLSSISETLESLSDRIYALEKDKVTITRDNEYNYKQKTPVNNEVCLVDVPGKGLRVKVGDGVTLFTDLPYIDDYALTTVDNLIVKGYFHAGAFYRDASHSEKLEEVQGKVYIDIVTSKTYGFTGVSYESTVVKATASTAGIVKLYDELGTNTDGAMTQRAVTEELNQKFEVDLDETQEMLIFDNDLDDNI